MPVNPYLYTAGKAFSEQRPARCWRTTVGGNPLIMSTLETNLRNLSTHILLNADFVEEDSTSKFTVLHVEPHLYEKFLQLLESMTQ